jgi:hypothetical protein
MARYQLIQWSNADESCQADTLDEAEEVAPEECPNDAKMEALDRTGDCHYPVCLQHAQMLREAGLAAGPR